MDHERCLICEWIISSTIDGYVSTSPELSIHRLAQLLGVQPQTVRKQIQHKGFPYHYLPGGMSKPLGKFGSVFISKQLPTAHNCLLLESQLLGQLKHGKDLHLVEFERSSTAVQSRILRYFKGEYSPKVLPHQFVKHFKKKGSAVRNYVFFGPLGLSKSEWDISFPNISVRLLKALPQCWAARVSLSRSVVSRPNSVASTKASQPNSNKTQAHIKPHSEVSELELLLETLSDVLQSHFELGVEQKKPIAREVYYSLAFIANSLLDEIQLTGTATKLWTSESEVSISQVVPDLVENITDLRVYYKKNASSKHTAAQSHKFISR